MIRIWLLYVLVTLNGDPVSTAVYGDSYPGPFYTQAECERQAARLKKLTPPYLDAGVKVAIACAPVYSLLEAQP